MDTVVVFDLNVKDRIILAAFVLGVHIRNDLELSDFMKHSPEEISKIANGKILHKSKNIVSPSDVVEALNRIIKMVDI
jgi:hypothetical protein